ncbi:conserved hypothetical protein TIGR00252 [Luminiphilus syltensis NOR5-1B]|uniref:UPF0102 protein NOR51B_33 n=1 Tax=Luminiphilus syltensis NOR5-1B TaxID=565045 RepID=B8KR63_9GAMM|nr:YraN family protein [Luminiphilus syltensis]EED34096.1 conserved hypothetical protein TIGR00252 [Luminiphilus syltensis NOR5-1B]
MRSEGNQWEIKAASFLRGHGLTIIVQNFTCPFGEIDLIGDDQGVIVFVEVRKRKRSRFGNAASSVGRAKQKKIIRSAAFYLQQHGAMADTHCRFDVIAYDVGADDPDTPKWLRSAFSANAMAHGYQTQ